MQKIFFSSFQVFLYSFTYVTKKTTDYNVSPLYCYYVWMNTQQKQTNTLWWSSSNVVIFVHQNSTIKTKEDEEEKKEQQQPQQKKFSILTIYERLLEMRTNKSVIREEQYVTRFCTPTERGSLQATNLNFCNLAWHKSILLKERRWSIGF